MRAFRHTICRAFAVLTVIVIAGCGGSGSGSGYGDGGGPMQTPPTISLNALPATSVNRTVPLTATPTALAGVARVDFLVDGIVVGTSTTAPYTFNWDTSAVADGPHSISASVTDNANVVATSAVATVNVNNDPVIQVTLSPAEVIPTPTPVSTATGSGQITVNLLNGSVTGGVTTTGIAAMSVNIQDAFAGSAGPAIVNFVQNATDPNRWDAPAGTMLTADQVNDLIAGKLYVNVISAAYPQGEIRGQLKPDNITVVFTPISGTDVVPAVTTTATGIAVTTVDSVALTGTVHATATGVDDATEAHVHEAPAGSNNPTVLFALTKDPTAPGHWFAELQPITATDLTDFQANGWYVDIHTPANPGGELRGQVTPNPPPPPTPPAAVTLTQLQSTIFSPRCSVCHTGGGSALPGSMDLTSAAATFAALVNVASIEQPALLRVKPGDSANSYVVHKVEGAADIIGGRMPLGGPFLDQPTIDQITSWIDAGAANN